MSDDDYRDEIARVQLILKVPLNDWSDYWQSYWVGLPDALSGRDRRKEDPSWNDVESFDETVARRRRGYRDGLEWRPKSYWRRQKGIVGIQ